MDDFTSGPPVFVRVEEPLADLARNDQCSSGSQKTGGYRISTPVIPNQGIQFFSGKLKSLGSTPVILIKGNCQNPRSRILDFADSGPSYF